MNSNKQSTISSLGISSAQSSKFIGVKKTMLNNYNNDCFDDSQCLSECESVVVAKPQPDQILQPEFQEESECQSVMVQKLKMIQTMVHEREETSQQATHLRNEQMLKNISFHKINTVPEVIEANNSLIHPTTQCIQLKTLKTPNEAGKSPTIDTIFEGEGALITIGRKETNQIVLSDPFSSVSQNHAQITFDKEKKVCQLHDLKSTNGTFIVVPNMQLKVNDRIAIGLNVCTVKQIRLDLLNNSVRLCFTNMVDESIPELIIEAQLNGTNKFYIGKAHQKQLERDPMIAADHCYIQWNSQTLQIKLISCEGVDYPIARAVTSDKPVNVKNGDIFRFGLIKFYEFLTFVKKNDPNSGADQCNKRLESCRICSEAKQTICTLKPCDHSGFCIECMLQLCKLAVPKCTVCNYIFADFVLKN